MEKKTVIIAWKFNNPKNLIKSTTEYDENQIIQFYTKNNEIISDGNYKELLSTIQGITSNLYVFIHKPNFMLEQQVEILKFENRQKNIYLNRFSGGLSKEYVWFINGTQLCQNIDFHNVWNEIENECKPEAKRNLANRVKHDLLWGANRGYWDELKKVCTKDIKRAYTEWEDEKSEDNLCKLIDMIEEWAKGR